MADTTVTSPVPRRRWSWLRIAAWSFGGLVVLLVVVYFVATSSAFLKGAILPRVSRAMNAEVTVSDASVSPFSQILLHNLKVVPAGRQPLVTAPEVRLRYSLMDIIRGNLHVDEVTLNSPSVTLVTDPDGSSNLDPILKAQKQQAKAVSKEQKPGAPAKPSKPTQLDIRKVALTEATIRTIRNYAGGKSNVAEISHLNVKLDNLKNGAAGKLTIGADINVQNNPPAPAASGLLQGKVNGSFDLGLTADLKPNPIQGSTKLEVERAEGSLARAAQFAGTFSCNLTPTDIKEVALRFQQAGTPLGLVRLSGPFDMQKVEGRLALEVLNIDRNLLNLAGASSGIDFGPTTLSSTNVIQVAKAGALISAAGRFSLDQFQLTRTNQTTPPLDLHADYDVTLDRAASNAVLRGFTLTGTQKGNRFLHGELASPMTVAFGGGAGAVGDSALTVSITRFDLADWKAFLGEVTPAGVVNGQLKLLSQQAGKLLTFDLNSRVDNLTAGSGSNQITQATVTLQMNGKATDFKQFNLPGYKLEVARQNQPLADLSGSATYNQTTQNADVQLNGQILIARLLQALSRPDLDVSSGTAEAKLHIVQTGQAPGTRDQGPGATQTITGKFTLADFSGRVGSNVFRRFGTVADLEAGMTPQQVQIRKMAGRITQDQTVGGTFALSGSYDLTNQSGQLTAKLADFNQAGLGAFLQPMLGDKKLASVALNADALMQYDSRAASTVKGDLQVTNLVVNDPSGQLPATPLEARMRLDAGLDKQVVTVRQLLLALTPTARATNQAQLTGQVDMSQPKAIQGGLKLAADSLDFTSYYDLFAGQKRAAKPAPAAAPSAPPAAAAPEKEPEARPLPFRNFTFETAIRRIYLHEVEIADLQNTTRLDGGHVVLNPCKLTLNGAPVNALADLDLGVPGYKYNLSFNAQTIPLAPLVNSFEPDRKGLVSGTLTAQSKWDGAGITGVSLKKNLTGQFDFNATNLNLSIEKIQGNSATSRLLKSVINVIGVIPELVANPASTVTSLVGKPFSKDGGKSGSTGSLTADLMKSPLDSFIARGTAGSGRVELRQARVQSQAFQASATGTVTLADVLTNSTLHIPVSISLGRSIAQHVNMTGTAAPNEAYAKMPDFLTLTGTLGNPKTDINKTALAGAVVGIKPGLGGGGLQGLGGVLGGKSSTNAAATNRSPLNPFKGLFKK